MDYIYRCQTIDIDHIYTAGKTAQDYYEYLHNTYTQGYLHAVIILMADLL